MGIKLNSINKINGCQLLMCQEMQPFSSFNWWFNLIVFSFFFFFNAGLVSEPQSKVEEDGARERRPWRRERADEWRHSSISQHQLSVPSGPQQEAERTTGDATEVRKDRWFVVAFIVGKQFPNGGRKVAGPDLQTGGWLKWIRGNILSVDNCHHKTLTAIQIISVDYTAALINSSN